MPDMPDVQPSRDVVDTRHSSVNLEDTTLVLSSDAQWHTAQVNQYPTWFEARGYRDFDDFIERRRLFFDRTARWNATDGKPTFLTWALVPRSDPGTGNILCGCETYLRPGVYLPPGSSEPIDCTSYGIACVYTNAAHRGNGYARHMMRLLHYILAPADTLPPFPLTWGKPPVIPSGMQDAVFSVLYSGVGKEFYAKCTKGENEPGWMPEELIVRQWNVQQPATEPDLEGWTWLHRDELPAWEQEASHRIRRDLINKGDKNKTRLAILPDPGCFGVHAVRYEVIPGARPEAAYGLVLPEVDGERPFFTYSVKPGARRKPEELRDSETEPQDSPEAYNAHDRARLVVMYSTPGVPWYAVVAAATREGVNRIEAWQGYGWDEEAGGAVMLPEENQPCLAVYGVTDNDVEWEFDEKYAWV
ncbi:hypothetical protein CcaverHIS002_0307610 [Cutaneotrichosporon cavernicola]|nr:hypothetical protein CcaverHIS002_0307610 [Cutaneotrichosporon cavernicola]BEI98460.1 hypothetical protein CcaverHIS631_0307590 [Cutaneotrichosporon cavernicola]BEJ06233.1 hypothetical protein CcaverHIS641_0307550 [Cutaneotrichosporon cavernicola]